MAHPSKPSDFQCPCPRSRREVQSATRHSYNIREVAQAAKVSVATVSRTLQMPDFVAPQTRSRVREAIERLGYTPNAQARHSAHGSHPRHRRACTRHFQPVLRGSDSRHRAGRASERLLRAARRHAKQPRPGEGLRDLFATKQADGLITLLPHVPRVSRVRSAAHRQRLRVRQGQLDHQRVRGQRRSSAGSGRIPAHPRTPRHCLRHRTHGQPDLHRPRSGL